MFQRPISSANFRRGPFSCTPIPAFVLRHFILGFSGHAASQGHTLLFDLTLHGSHLGAYHPSSSTSDKAKFISLFPTASHSRLLTPLAAARQSLCLSLVSPCLPFSWAHPCAFQLTSTMHSCYHPLGIASRSSPQFFHVVCPATRGSIKSSSIPVGG